MRYTSATQIGAFAKIGFGTAPTASASDAPPDRVLLFVYFQVNKAVLYFLDYVEDIYIMVLSVLVSM